MRLIDISVTLSAELPVWPGGYGYHLHRTQSITEKTEANVSRIDLDVHSGTHIDAPLHFVKDGKTTLEIPLERMVGKCQVIECAGTTVIRPEHLRGIEAGIKRLLLKTNNTANSWFLHPFDQNFVALSNEAAQLLVDFKLELIGIDGPSIQKFTDPSDTHITLPKNEVVILEGLNLADVAEGFYELTCLPLKARDVEGIPARAILKTYE